ncbi:MAG: transporter [Vitreoscilla sp.]
MAVRIPSLLAALVLAVAAPASFAAHPLQTEDTATQGVGNLEIENGLQRTRFDSITQTTYQPQLSLGLAATLDGIVQPAWIWQRAGAQRESGMGDTNVDAKWRFWGSEPLSLAIRGGVMLATNEHGLGLTHGKTSEHAVLALTWDRAPTRVHVNVGGIVVPRAAASPARRVMASVSAAVMQQVDEHLTLTVDASFAQSPNPHKASWPGTVLAGAIWTVRPGLDVDVGWQRSIDDTPTARTWLAGLTYRFAL